ncbi:hypothetical protein ACS0TY_003813 [Phlomoides rotata]
MSKITLTFIYLSLSPNLLVNSQIRAPRFDNFSPKIAQLLQPSGGSVHHRATTTLLPQNTLRNIYFSFPFCPIVFGGSPFNLSHAERQATVVVHGGEAIGSGGSKETRFRGVRKRSWGRYAAEIKDPWKKTRVWLGTFDSAEDVARAYDADARSLRGPKVYGTSPRSDSYTLTFQC